MKRRIIPALAGNTCWLVAAKCFSKDHPRSRGEYSSDDVDDEFTPGSSPLSRGIRNGGIRFIE